MTQTPQKSKAMLNNKKSNKTTVAPFIAKTYEILEECQYPDIIDWNFEGTAIVIKKPTEFAEQVLAVHFKHRNLTSFVRQLHMYNFHKQRTQKIEHVYSHELFQRDKKHLLPEIKRKNQDHVLPDADGQSDEPEVTELNQSLTELIQEKNVLKRSNAKALNKINCLEGKIKDLCLQNQELRNKITQQDERDKILISLMANILKKYGIPPSELSSMMIQAPEETLSKNSGKDGSNNDLLAISSDELSTLPSLPTIPTLPDVNGPNSLLNLDREPRLSKRSSTFAGIGLEMKNSTSREISPSCFLNKSETNVSSDWDPFMAGKQQAFLFRKEREKESFSLFKGGRSGNHYPINKGVWYNEIDLKTRMMMPVATESCLGKRRFEEEKEGDGIQNDLFDTKVKKVELVSSFQNNMETYWNTDIINHTYRKNKEDEESTNFLNFKQAF